MWQKPGTMQTTGSPTHKVPVHPGADDDTDDEEEFDQDNIETKESTEKMIEHKYEPIKNLIDEPTDESENKE